MAYEVVEHQGQMALNTLQRVHPKQQLPARFGTVEVDTAAFLLRQQEAAAAAESNISPEQQGEQEAGMAFVGVVHMQLEN